MVRGVGVTYPVEAMYSWCLPAHHSEYLLLAILCPLCACMCVLGVVSLKRRCGASLTPRWGIGF